jgi:hypothetical protein
MIYLKSICVGLACVLGALYVVFFITGIVLRFVASPQGKGTVGFFISFRSPIVWLPSLIIFASGSFWAYRRLSR